MQSATQSFFFLRGRLGRSVIMVDAFVKRLLSVVREPGIVKVLKTAEASLVRSTSAARLVATVARRVVPDSCVALSRLVDSRGWVMDEIHTSQ